MSCNSTDKDQLWRKAILQPKDGSQNITIFTLEEKRYIVDGYHEEIPDTGYLLLDMTKVDHLGDAISVCWNEGGYKWKISSAYAKLIDNKLDTSKYLYYQSLGEYGQPTSEGYTGDNCGGILIREKRKPRGNIVLKYLKNR